ncbi:MAG: sensor histidine kinase [Pseudobutyrivibrio sp.]|nr:sensor histidine kinase [Pseudobutyrivibrio sp.]
MKHRIRSKAGIRASIIIATTVFTCIVGLVITISGYYLYSQYMEDSIIETAQTNLRFLSDYIDNETDNIDQLVSYCNTSNTINMFISSKIDSRAKKNDAYEALNEYVTSNTSSKYLHRIVVTNLYDSYIQVVAPTYSSTINVASALTDQEFYDSSLAAAVCDYNYGFMSDPFYPRKDIQVIPLLKPLAHRFNSDLGGYIFIEVKKELFEDAFKNAYHEESQKLLLTLGEQTYIFEDGNLINLEGEFDSTDYTVITQELKKKDCSVSLAIPMKEVLSTKALFLGMLVLIIFLLIVLTTFLNGVLDNVINAPVDKIRHRLNLIAQGDFSRDVSIEWDHELGEIGRGVNDLAESVKELLSTKIRDTKEKKDLEYKMLQSQINPHFIYNTLNSIKWMATTQGATGITEMTTALARLLKSISKGTKLLIPVSEELELVKDYFTIQSYRYGGTIELIINCESDMLLDCQIIKFTLQPLVENAIFHGIEPTGKSGTVTINIYERDETLTIDITDDGIGMTKEQTESILEASAAPSDFFKEIGVSNVHKRLQYQFGTGYGILVSSTPGIGTTMSVNLPINYESDK